MKNSGRAMDNTPSPRATAARTRSRRIAVAAALSVAVSGLVCQLENRCADAAQPNWMRLSWLRWNESVQHDTQGRKTLGGAHRTECHCGCDCGRIHQACADSRAQAFANLPPRPDAQQYVATPLSDHVDSTTLPRRTLYDRYDAACAGERDPLAASCPAGELEADERNGGEQVSRNEQASQRDLIRPDTKPAAEVDADDDHVTGRSAAQLQPYVIVDPSTAPPASLDVDLTAPQLPPVSAAAEPGEATETVETAGPAEATEPAVQHAPPSDLAGPPEDAVPPRAFIHQPR